ncbi:MAG: hypothetical protein ACTSVV_11045, partial [Promethearchaeota archaeon]
MAQTKMTIRDVFDKTRDPLRNLNQVVKVIDSSSTNLWIEFDEFILTEALLDYLKEFYDDFTKPISYHEPNKPIWLEGFYGSGKSHFSKLIGLLFENVKLKHYIKKKLVEEWNAIDFFINKILKTTKFDNEASESKRLDLIESLRIYEKQFNCKTIFINLSTYSKAETNQDNIMESFTIALLKEFNKSIGLAESIEIAEIEKNLIREGLYERFKDLIKKEENEDWEKVRLSGPWAHRTFINVYRILTNCSEIEAKAYIEGAKSDCEQKNINNILNEINNWAKKNLRDAEKGIEPRVLIILDEAGLYFSAKASRIGEMMAAAEWINTSTNESCIDMIFNAQQSIKTYFESVKTTVDYRTAEQRFKHWFLDKKNIKQVVVKRWLKKDSKENGPLLYNLINNRRPQIIDGTVFDTIKDPRQEYSKPSIEEIVETYPFLPYQFPLMIQITQSLIAERAVEEQYGGKTRSILVMTREILEDKPKYLSCKHFVDAPLGTFVILSQIYGAVTHTLKTKEEDQFLLVEISESLNEKDFTEFTDEDREIPITFHDVMKSILLLNYIPEVPCSANNIAKSLFYSTSGNNEKILNKVNKIINILKRKGFISYRKQKLPNDKGESKEYWEFQVASIKEKKYIEKTYNTPILEEEKYNFLASFFEKEEGKDIIKLSNIYNISELLDEEDKPHNLDNSVKIKCNWKIDPDLDKLEAEIISSDKDLAYIILITPFTIYNDKWRNKLKSLENKINIICIRTLKDHKMTVFIRPSLNLTKEQIEEKYKELNQSITEYLRFEKISEEDSNIMPVDVRFSFQHRKEEFIKIIKNQFINLYSEGFINYGQAANKITDYKNINALINNALKQMYSEINKYAYLGQVKLSAKDINTILTWDKSIKHKKSKIPIILRKSNPSEQTKKLFLFNEDGTELKPNYAPQTMHVNREIKKEMDNNPNKIISGYKILDTFSKPPYSWLNTNTLVIIAALIKNNEYEIQIKGEIYNPDDAKVLKIFGDSVKKIENFKDVSLKIAEKLSQKDLNKVKDILTNLFNIYITKVGTDALDEEITKLSSEIIKIY